MKNNSPLSFSVSAVELLQREAAAGASRCPEETRLKKGRIGLSPSADSILPHGPCPLSAFFEQFPLDFPMRAPALPIRHGVYQFS